MKTRLHFFTILLSLLFLGNRIYAQVPNFSYTPSTNVYTSGTAISSLTPVTATGGGAVPATTYSQVTTISTPGGTFNSPETMTMDNSGNFYVADYVKNKIFKITSTGTVTTLAGSGTAGTAGGIGTLAQFNGPDGIAYDGAGNLYVADANSNLIRKIVIATGLVSTYAGIANTTGHANGALLSSTFNAPEGLAFDASGNLYVADFSNNSIRKISGGTVSTFAGGGASGTSSGSSAGTGTAALFKTPTNMVADALGNLYVADYGNNSIRAIVISTQVVTTLATGFNLPADVAMDPSGNILVAEQGANKILLVTTAGAVSTLAGSGAATELDGTGTAAKFDTPASIQTDNSGNCYVMDWPGSSSGTIRKIVLTGYTISATLPTGLLFNVTTGVISGTPTVTSPATNYTVTGYNASGSASTVVNIAVGTGVVWKGTSNVKWSNAANWSTGKVPTSADNVSVGGGTPFAPTVDVAQTINSLTTTSTVTITLSTALTVNNALTDNGSLTFAGTSTATLSGATTFSNNMLLTINSGSAVIYPSGSSLTLGQNTVFTNNGTCTFTSSNINLSGNSSSIVNGGTLNITSTPIAMGFTTSFTNSGTCGINSLTITDSNNNCTLGNTGSMTLTTVIINMSAQTDVISNTTSSGKMILDGTTVNFTGGSPTNGISNGAGATFSVINHASALNMGSYQAYISNSGTFYAGATGVACNINLTTQQSTLTNASTGSFILTSSTLSLSNYQSSITNNGSFTAYGGSTINLGASGSTSCTLTNYGTFYAGTSGSLCTINLLGGTPTISNTNSGVVYGYFFLGPGSIIYPTSTTCSVTNSTSCTFTLQSDGTGSAAIAAISSSASPSLPFSGTYNVERYFQGGTTYDNVKKRWVERNYRIISSPVNTGTKVNSNYVYGLNYIVGSTAGKTTTASSATNAFLAGTKGGSTAAGNPSLFLYRENLVPKNSSFTGGNFIGITDITNSTSAGTITASDGSTYSIPIGNAVFFFFRGAATNWTTRTSSPYIAPDNVTLTSTGNLNQQPVTVKDWYSPTSSTLGYTVTGVGTGSNTNYAVRGYNLVGNPYPCSIDWNTAFSGTGITLTNVNPTIWVFNPVSNQYDTYKTTSSSGGTATGSASNIIASGQGFFVQATPAGAASLVFNEAAKVPTSQVINGNLLMGTPAGQRQVQQMVRLKLVADSLNADDIVIGFNPEASSKYRGEEDAMYIAGSSALEGLSSFSDENIQLSINYLPLPKRTAQVVRLNVTATESHAFTLERTALAAIPPIYEVWLMDNHKKDSLDLRNNSTYAFDIDLTDTSSFGKNRFQIVVRQNPELNVHLLNFNATKTAGGAQLVWKTENEQNYTYFTVERSTDGGGTFNVLGGFSSSAIGTYSLLDKKAFPLGATTANDKYRLKIEDLNGTFTYSQVVTLNYSISNKDANDGNIVVYPNPASSLINVTINPNPVSFTSNLSVLETQSLTPGLNTTNGSPTYSIKIINITGSVVKTSTSSSNSWEGSVSNLSPGTYIIQVINTRNNSLVGKTTFVKL